MMIPRFSCEKWDEYKSQIPKNAKDKKEKILIISQSSRETWYEYISKMQRKEKNKKEKTMIIPRFSCLEWEEYISQIEKYNEKKGKMKILPVSCQKWDEFTAQKQKSIEDKKGRSRNTRKNLRKDVPKARVMTMPYMKNIEEAKIERMIAYFKDLPLLKKEQLKRYLEEVEDGSLCDKLREEFIWTASNNKPRKKVAKEEKNFLKDNYLEEYVIKNELSYVSLRIYDVGFCFCLCTPDDPNYEESDFVMYNKVNAMYLDILNSVNCGKIPDQFFQLFKSYGNIHAIYQDLVEAQEEKHFVGQQLRIKLSKLKENKTKGKANIPDLIIFEKIKSLKLQSKIDKLQKELESLNYHVNFVHKFHMILKIEKFTSRNSDAPFFSTFILLKPTSSSIYSFDSCFLPTAHIDEENQQMLMNVIESELYYDMAKNLHLKVGHDCSWNTIHLLQSYKRPFGCQTVSEALVDKNKELKQYLEEEKKKEEYILLNFAHVTSTHNDICPADFWNIPKSSSVFHFEDFKETLCSALTSREINMKHVLLSSTKNFLGFTNVDVGFQLSQYARPQVFLDVIPDRDDLNLLPVFSFLKLVEIFFITTKKEYARKEVTDENVHQYPVLMDADEKTHKICVYIKHGLYYIYLTTQEGKFLPFSDKFLHYIGNRFQLDKYILSTVEILTEKFKKCVTIDHEEILSCNNELPFPKRRLFSFQDKKALILKKPKLDDDQSNHYITNLYMNAFESKENLNFGENSVFTIDKKVFENFDIGKLMDENIQRFKKFSYYNSLEQCAQVSSSDSDGSDIRDVYAGPFTDIAAQNAPSNGLEDSLTQTEKSTPKEKESYLSEGGNCKSGFSDISHDQQLPETCSEENNSTDAIPPNDSLSTDFVNSPSDVVPMYNQEDSENAAQQANISSAVSNSNEPLPKRENNKNKKKCNEEEPGKQEKKVIYVEKIRNYGDGYTTMFEAHDHNIRLDSCELVELTAELFTRGLKFYDCVKDKPVPVLPADHKDFPFKFSKGELLEMKEVLEDIDARYRFRESLGLNYNKLGDDSVSFWEM